MRRGPAAADGDETSKCLNAKSTTRLDPTVETIVTQNQRGEVREMEVAPSLQLPGTNQAPVVYRKSHRASSDKDHETWVPAQTANTLNAFDTGERDTHGILHPVPLLPTGNTGANGAGIGQPGDPAPALRANERVAVGVPTPVADKLAFELVQHDLEDELLVLRARCHYVRIHGDAWAQRVMRGELDAEACRAPAAVPGLPIPALAGTLRSGSDSPAAHGKKNGVDRETLVPGIAHTLKAAGADGSEDGTGRGVPIVEHPTAVGFYGGASDPHATGDLAAPITRRNGDPGMVGVADTLTGSYGKQIDSRDSSKGPPNLIPVPDLAGTLRGQGRNNSNPGTEAQMHVPVEQAIGFDCKRTASAGEVAPTLRGMGHDESHANGGGQLAVSPPLGAAGTTSGRTPGLDTDSVEALQVQAMRLRRLTPTECERLMGMPEGWTLIPYGRQKRKVEPDMAAYIRRTLPDATDEQIALLAKDGPRYVALGNSIAVPVLRHIGERIQLVSEVMRGLRS